MVSVPINKEGVKLVLTQAIGKVRVADGNGNHIRRPATEGRNIGTNFAEWMITNEEIGKLARSFLDVEDRNELINKLSKINKFIRDSKYATREAIRTTTEKLDKFGDFDIYKYTENFYSFEKQIKSGIIIRITFKMGDYTLAPHMYVLIPFGHQSFKIINNSGEVPQSEILGKKCFGFWTPNKEDVKEIVVSLSNASESHRNDLVRIIKE